MINPKLVEQHYKAGISFYNSANMDNALKEFNKVLLYAPEHPETCNLIGLILFGKGEIETAVRYFGTAISNDSKNPFYYVNLGLALQEKGEISQAINCFEKAIILAPENALLYNGLGVTLESTGKSLEAINNFQKAIRLNPENSEFYFNNAISYQSIKNYSQAINNYQAAIRINPQSAKYLTRMANLFDKLQDYKQSLIYYEQAISLNLQNPFYYNNYAIALQNTGNFSGAITNYRKAIQLKPDFAIFYSNLGTAYEDWQKPEQALFYYQRATEMEPDNIYFYNNLAGGYIEIGDLQTALEKYLFAFSLSPTDPDTNYNLSLLYLLQEDFVNGWHQYSCFGCKSHTIQMMEEILKKPVWRGESLEGKRIYIYSDQGFGDTIQFVRYLPIIKEMGAYIIFGCQSELKSLLENCQGYDMITDQFIPPPETEYDLQVSLLSIPAILKISFDSIHSIFRTGPYIFPKAELTHTWQKVLIKYPGFKIGIAWEPDALGKTRFKRRFPLENFYELAKIPGITLCSLQKGKAGQQLKHLPPELKIINLAAEINNFADTAAIIKNLDLVITIDTALAHLAGAMSKTVWMLLPFSADWRWFLNRSESPWYPAMRLFRQTKPGNWDVVTERLKTELSKHLDVY